MALGSLDYANQLIQHGEYALAVVALNKQIKDYPVEARYLLSLVYLLEGKYDKAEVYLKEARRLGLEDERYYAMRGRLALFQGRWELAWASLRSAALLSGNGRYSLEMGLVGLARGRLDEAKLGFEKARRAGRAAEGEFLEGMALVSVDPRAALELLRMAQMELSPDSPLKPQAIYWQARALEKLGEINEARSTLRFLLRNYPDYGPAREALNRLGP